ncbi:hypothetical protein F5B21DRAFT_283959 [Xylaria acuta]|nr:hypothetical protein F5B21DRAFT_283959 [Xylaria acuta]
MSSVHSTGDAPAQRVPAWKRLGLKLKPASEGQSHDVTHHPTSTTTSTPTSVPNNNSNRTHLAGSTPNAKRRASGGAPALDHSAKRARQDNWQDRTSSHQTPKRAKSVSFTADTAEPQQPPASVKTKQQKQTSAKGAVDAAPTKPIKKSAPVNLEPALAYLRTWHTARENWKFNKNHQTKLLEQVFAGADETTIPAADIGVFYGYVRGLQGGVRTRLRELANGIKARDMEQGAEGFAASASAKGKEMAERKQKEYEEVIRTFLGQTRTPEKRRFDEVEYVLRTTDTEMQRRVVKRMRAEMVLDELSETDGSETTTTTTTTTSGESSTTEKGNNPGNQSGRGADDDDDKRLRLNDGPQQRTKRKRKLRTAAVEEDTSSESESESNADSDASSSGSSSSSSSSSDEDEDEDAGARTNEDTSSSSSSSSSESESDSDDSDED